MSAPSTENHIEAWEARTGRTVATMTEQEALDLLWLRSPLFRRACATAGDRISAAHVIAKQRKQLAELRQILASTKADAQQLREKEIEASWLENPERMGR